MKHRMINCSVEAVENLYFKRDWARIFKNTRNIRIPTSIPVDLEECVHDQSETVWELLSLEGIRIYQNEPFVDELVDNSKSLLDYPKDMFVIDGSLKRSLCRSNYGVVVMPNRSAQASMLKIRWNEPLLAGDLFNWKKFFTDEGRDMSKIPTNALIIVDLYLFDLISPGANNVKNILEELLPQNFSDTYNILIITDPSVMKKAKNTPISSLESAVKDIQHIIKRIKRPYPLSLEMWFIESAQWPTNPQEQAHFELYKACHNRRIFSNTYVITADHGFSAVRLDNNNQVARWPQNITFECNYAGISDKYQKATSLPIKHTDDILFYISQIIDNGYNVGRYFLNGVEGNVVDITNRMLK